MPQIWFEMINFHFWFSCHAWLRATKKAKRLSNQNLFGKWYRIIATLPKLILFFIFFFFYVLIWIFEIFNQIFVIKEVSNKTLREDNKVNLISMMTPFFLCILSVFFLCVCVFLKEIITSQSPVAISTEPKPSLCTKKKQIVKKSVSFFFINFLNKKSSNNIFFFLLNMLKRIVMWRNKVIL